MSRVEIQKVEVLSDNWYVLRKYTFRYRRGDGVEQTLSREVYDRGNGAAILAEVNSVERVAAFASLIEPNPERALVRFHIHAPAEPIGNP